MDLVHIRQILYSKERKKKNLKIFCFLKSTKKMSATTNFDSHMMCTVGIKSENCSIYGCRSTLFIVGKLLIWTFFQILNDFFFKNCNIYGNFYDKMVGQRCNFIGPQYNWPTQLYFFRILGGKNQCLHGFSINEEMSKIVDFFNQFISHKNF